MRIFLLAGFLAIAACNASPQGQADEANVENTADVSTAVENVETSATDANAADMNAADMSATDMNAVDVNMDMNAMAAIEPGAGLPGNATANAAANAAVEVSPNAAPPPKMAAPAAPRVKCDVIEEMVTEEDCEDAETLAEDVKPGAAALDVPDPMTRGRPSQVTLVIDRRSLAAIHQIETAGKPATEGAAETPNQVAGGLPGKDYAFASGVGRFMTASLAGQGFKIRLLSPEDPLQEIARDGQGIWIWEVIPETAGPHILTAKTEAVVVIGGHSHRLGNGMTSKNVRVEVRPIDTVHDFLSTVPDWIKLITAILVAAAALVAAWFGLRKAMRG
jgi:hypothetical protein